MRKTSRYACASYPDRSVCSALSMSVLDEDSAACNGLAKRQNIAIPASLSFNNLYTAFFLSASIFKGLLPVLLDEFLKQTY